VSYGIWWVGEKVKVAVSYLGRGKSGRLKKKERSIKVYRGWECASFYVFWECSRTEGHEE
jgi:hypothetical protein